ncbi:chaperonin CPN60, mitochondrial-like isoform X2 [Actinidia eriantha]|uniref:chaperonin CPN60, mitochondrial-like isoform X2 n=1 Tax=Actinidia eriantha TaxID=165200 RepID=UPI00258FC6AC|nr:chaperonin CPN60, mitochondrial-like isoform X2 [Actinidia eriantha]
MGPKVGTISANGERVIGKEGAITIARQKYLLIVSEDVESEELRTLILSKLRAGIKVCIIKAPGFGENRKANLQDLAVLTRSAVTTDELGLNFKIGFEMLGTRDGARISSYRGVRTL